MAKVRLFGICSLKDSDGNKLKDRVRFSNLRRRRDQSNLEELNSCEFSTRSSNLKYHDFADGAEYSFNATLREIDNNFKLTHANDFKLATPLYDNKKK